MRNHAAFLVSSVPSRNTLNALRQPISAQRTRINSSEIPSTTSALLRYWQYCSTASIGSSCRPSTATQRILSQEILFSIGASMRCVAVLGRQDEPIDAVEQYCQYLSSALVVEGISLELMRVRWAEIGWRKALRVLREGTLETRNAAWFLMQYTALAWSRRGFSIRALRVIRALKRSGARCAVVFHDAEAYSGSRYVDRMRRAVQIHTMRQALYLADLAVMTIPAEIIPWVPPSAQNIVFIPVGANLPSPETVWKRTTDHRTDSPAVAVFSLSGDGARAEEVRLIAEAVSHAGVRIGKLRVVVFGRNSDIG